jgi:hypothetical protein
MIVLSYMPFCPYDGRQASLKYLPAAARYTTRRWASGYGQQAVGRLGRKQHRCVCSICLGKTLPSFLPIAFAVLFPLQDTYQISSS